MPVQAMNGRCLKCGYRLAWILVRCRRQPFGSALLVVPLSKTFLCCDLAGKKAARNDPECHYSRLYRAGVFVPVVAQQVQDMSALSITHKTVGVRLPRL
jgi:hypothetical protein